MKKSTYVGLLAAFAMVWSGEFGKVFAQGGDPAWKRPYAPTRLEWVVMDLNVHDRTDCDREGLDLTFGGKPNLAIRISAHSRSGPIDERQRECIGRVLATVQEATSLGFGLPPP